MVRIAGRLAPVLDPFHRLCELPPVMRAMQKLVVPSPSRFTDQCGARSTASEPLTSGWETRWRRSLRALPQLIALLAATLPTQVTTAGVVTWEVDPTASYLRLTIPDQSVAVTNVGNITIRMRDANSTSQWTDAGGRRAALAGVLVTDYTEAPSIRFLGGAHDLWALDAASLRPNPTAWDTATASYTNTTSAPAALGGRVRGTYLIATFDAAFLAFRAVRLDITNAAPGDIALTNGAFASHTTCCGIQSALVDVDGLELPLGLGQPIPDVLHASLSPMVQTNAAGGSITNLGGSLHKLTYPINLPDLAINLGDTVIAGSAAGLIVATAVIPPPAPPPTLSVRRQGAAIVLAWPTNATGFALEYATQLPTTNWFPVSPLPVVINGENIVTNWMTPGAAFYRLRKP